MDRTLGTTELASLRESRPERALGAMECCY